MKYQHVSMLMLYEPILCDITLYDYYSLPHYMEEYIQGTFENHWANTEPILFGIGKNNWYLTIRNRILWYLYF